MYHTSHLCQCITGAHTETYRNEKAFVRKWNDTFDGPDLSLTIFSSGYHLIMLILFQLENKFVLVNLYSYKYVQLSIPELRICLFFVPFVSITIWKCSLPRQWVGQGWVQRLNIRWHWGISQISCWILRYLIPYLPYNISKLLSIFWDFKSWLAQTQHTHTHTHKPRDKSLYYDHFLTCVCIEAIFQSFSAANEKLCIDV